MSNICRREVETGGSPVLCLYFASLFRFQFCDPSLLFPFKYVFTSSLPIPTYLGAYLILSFRSLCPFACFLCTLSLRPWGQSSPRVARIPLFFVINLPKTCHMSLPFYSPSHRYLTHRDCRSLEGDISE